MARKMTPLQRKYRQAFRTVERRIAKLESQGYVFNKSKLPTYRKNITTSALTHVQKFTERYLKNMPSTQFRVGVNQYTTGKRGAEIQASYRGKKGARTRRVRAKERSKLQRELAKEEFQQSLLDTKYKGDERFEDTSYRDNEPDYRGEEARKEDALAESINNGESNDYYVVYPNGDIVDAETGEIVFEPSKYVELTKGVFQHTETGTIIEAPYMAGFFAGKPYGEALVDGLDSLISDYEQSDNRWVREKASALRDSFESADKDTMADNLGHMSSDFISYVQQVIEESGGNQNEVNNNYAKIVEIQALIEGRTLEMGSLRNSFAD